MLLILVSFFCLILVYNFTKIYFLHIKNILVEVLTKANMTVIIL